jgi:transposase
VAKDLTAAQVDRRIAVLSDLALGLTQRECAAKHLLNVRTVRRWSERFRAGAEVVPPGPLLDGLNRLYEEERSAHARIEIVRAMAGVAIAEARRLRALLRETGPVWPMPIAQPARSDEPGDPRLQRAAAWALANLLKSSAQDAATTST